MACRGLDHTRRTSETSAILPSIQFARMRTTGRRLLLLPLIFAGCSEDPGACGASICKVDRAPVSIETRLSEAAVAAGQSVGVTCIVAFDDGSSESIAPPQVSIAIEPDAAIEGATLTPSRAGTYTVHCEMGDAAVTPAKLEVTAGAASRSIASVEPATIESGAISNATCRYEDQYGNAAEASPAIEIDPSEGVAIAQL